MFQAEHICMACILNKLNMRTCTNAGDGNDDEEEHDDDVDDKVNDDDDEEEEDCGGGDDEEEEDFQLIVVVVMVVKVMVAVSYSQTRSSVPDSNKLDCLSDCNTNCI